ncbi:serine hydrolase domain-containing protein [Maribellus maritimus]|uniref:serine hydrolase domain-containing protein n=1 Tax=Maribellus maritimus TaxID=2870838 RepID=UPI001EEAD691|nr:serine hydrolase domain-containing protein [Maribellus maritimus]MCG6188534.1 beta-lactamase family protein [Maribellus maritimus]
MKKTLLSIAGIFLSIALFPQQFNKKKLDLLFENLASYNKFMGSIAVSQNGNLIYQKSVGYSDVESGITPDNHTKYRIGSISKTFTSVLILKAVEEKKLNLDETLDTFFPSIENSDKITIQHLLYHRSGIYSFTDDPEYQNWRTEPKSEKEIVGIISKGESLFLPGSIYKYSNPNYILLSYILEKTYKKSFAKILEEKITKPLQLKNTGFGGKIETEANEAYSYLYSKSWEKDKETDMSIPMGAGGIISTPEELTQFIEALFEGKLISKENIGKMTTIKDGYGMGIYILPFYDKKGFGHSGAIDGFTSTVVYFPDENISFALTSNGTNYSNNEITIKVLSSVFGKPFDIPEFKIYEVTSADLDKYLGIYSSKEIPLKVTITKDSSALIAQATGQRDLRLDAFDKDKFSFDKVGLIMEFQPEKETMLLKQNGSEFHFTKETAEIKK